MPSIQHLIVLLVIIMIFFGVGRLPDVLKQMGKGIREFKDASDGVERKNTARSRDEHAGDGDDGDDEEERAALEEFRRKRRAAKQIARDPSRDARTASSRVEESDDADSGGDNDDAGSAVRSKSRSG